MMPSLAIDHLLWATPDLDEGARSLEAATGVASVVGGSHPGFGTRNRLLSLGPGVYLELIAPDPAQSLAGNRGGVIAAMPRAGLLTYAVRGEDLGATAAAARALGLAVGKPVAMTRTRPDGMRLEWEVMTLEDARFGPAIPFVIDWKASPHPSASAPAGCTLTSLRVLQPDPAPLVALHAALGIDVAVIGAAHAGFVATLATPRGEVMLLG